MDTRMISQTDPDFTGWVFVFTNGSACDPERKAHYEELWKAWLEQWNPPREWMQ